MGNKLVADPARIRARPVVLDSLEGRIDLKGYPDALQRHRGADGLRASVAHDQPADLHQLGEPRGGSRAARRMPRSDEAARDLVDYMLFVDEAPLAGKIEGTSGIHADVLRRKVRATPEGVRCGSWISNGA